MTTSQDQLEFGLFRRHKELVKARHFRTTAYHFQANGMVKQLHRHLQTAIKCHGKIYWTEVLPAALLGIRAAWKEDMQATTVEVVYGQTLRLPGQLLELLHTVD